MIASRTVTIGITGKRMLTGEQLDAIKPVLKDVIKSIKQHEQEHSIAKIEIKGVSAIARGADALFAEVMLEMGYPLEVYIPFQEGAYREDFKVEGDRVQTQELLDQFDRLFSKAVNSDKVLSTLTDDSQRNEKYMVAGKKVVKESDYIIAIWDETTGLPSGTGDVVRYILEERYKKDYNDASKGLVVINYSGLAPVVKTALPLKGIHNNFEDSLPLYLYARSAEYDNKSQQLKKAYRQLWTYGLWMGLAAAAAFGFKMSFHKLAFLWTLIEAAMIIGIVILIRIKKPRILHSTFLLNRLVAEQIRTMKTYYWANIPVPPETESPFLVAITEHHSWQTGILNELQQLFRKKQALTTPGDYRREPILELVEEQHTYHEGRLARNRKSLDTYKILNRFFIISFVGLVLVKLIIEGYAAFKGEGHHATTCFAELMHWMHEGLGHKLLLLALLVLPAAIARMEAIKVFSEWEKLALQSHAMHHFFAKKKTELQHAKQTELRDILNDINQQMFHENLDWQISMLDKEPPSIG